MKTVYLNGQLMDAAHATVSVLDRGFLFGDGVYEVIPVYDSRLFRLPQHLRRLQRSLNAIELPLHIDLAAWESVLNQLIAANAPTLGNDQAVYLQITRGVAPERAHLFSADLTPTLYAQSTRFTPLSQARLNQGMTAITLPDYRWQRCSIKAIALLPNVLLYQQAKDAHCDEAILIRDQYVTEASTSNVFIVKDQVIKTPPLSDYILAGVTREYILELARKYQFQYAETPITLAELNTADEIWVTSSTKEIYPIVTLNQQPVGDGKPGPIWQQMIQHYRANLFAEALL